MAESANKANVEFHSVVGPNFPTCAEDIKKFIIDKQITKEQIISISAHEEGVNDGSDNPDVELVLYYNANGEPGVLLGEDLQIGVYRDTVLWDDIEAQFLDGVEKRDIIAVS